MKKLFSMVLAVSMLLLLHGCGNSARNDDKEIAVISIVDYGTIEVELYRESAPITVENFVNLVNQGFYDGLTFHRIISGFMIQGGDPNGDGTGGSGTEITGEFSSNGYDNSLHHTRGTISMARSGEPNSASSQFFIIHRDSLYLDGNYAAFGRVISGMEVVDAICADMESKGIGETVPRTMQPVMESVTMKK